MTSLQELEIALELWNPADRRRRRFAVIEGETPAPAPRQRDTRIVIPLPDQLVKITGKDGQTYQLLAPASDAYLRMLKAARNDGIAAPLLQIVSAYRSVQTQEMLWKRALEKYKTAQVAAKWVAEPGKSVHQSGRAIDFWLGVPNDSKNTAAQRKTDAYAWLVKNALRFDFLPYSAEPWHWEYTPVPVIAFEADAGMPGVPTVQSPPPLISTEQTPPSSTLYVRIPLGSGIPPTTGIFLPDHFHPTPAVDMILYLRGFHEGKTAGETTKDFWNAKVHPVFRAFREGLNASGRNFVLVAPSTGPRSQTGSLVGRNGLGKYIDTVLAALAANPPYSTTGTYPALGNLILACHSGGGLQMRSIATRKDERYVDLIRECWGFDCLYNDGDDTIWADWARNNPQRRLFVHYLDGTAKNSSKLKALASSKHLSNVQVMPSSATRHVDVSAHEYVPITDWLTRLNGAVLP